MAKPIIVDVSINRQGSDRDLRLYTRIYTPEDVMAVQSAVDTFLYDLLHDLKVAQEKDGAAAERRNGT